jgi:dihydrofolate synthase/folylpolyglutamate synthase
MDYSDAISYLFGLQKFGIKLGLENITNLLHHLGNPHKRLRCIHIAGSNGKGSTGAFLHSILNQHGYTAGFYTSPHLIDFTERIRIKDKEISREKVVSLTRKIRKVCASIPISNITFFELITAMAFLYFDENQADPVIIEVGMGGRYDATNVISPLMSIITSVSLEHQFYLGNTLLEIAREKAGIMKPRIPVICGVTQPRVKKFIHKRAEHLKSPFYQLGNDVLSRKTAQGTFNFKGIGITIKDIEYGLKGDHQARNASMAIAASQLLKKEDDGITIDKVKLGVKNVVWPGRLETVAEQPKIVLDGAHNPDAWKALKRSIVSSFEYRKLILILGVMEDKDIPKMLKILMPMASEVFFCRPKMERAAKKEFLQKFITFSPQDKVWWYENLSDALKRALKISRTRDMICVTGSLFAVGEAREILLNANAGSSGRIAL